MRPFLTAEWRDLAMFNWEVSANSLTPYLPAGTELDAAGGRTFLSLVGFRFLNTRLLKLRMPFHVNFEEVNLRFYVKRAVDGQTRRGVAFIKEIVPRACVALVARRWLNENFVAAPMSHRIEHRSEQTCVQYAWTLEGRTHSMCLSTNENYRPPAAGSHEEFIAEHYWGYSRQPDGGTVEFQVAHLPWQVATGCDFSLDGDFTALYGTALGEHLRSPPASTFLAAGSPVTVGRGRRL